MPDLKIALLQSALYWEDPARNLESFASRLDGLEDKPHLVLLPEMFTTGFSMNAPALAQTMEGTSVGWMRDMAARHRCALAGSLIIEEAGSYYNRLILMLPDGSTGHYDKRHLFAYAREEKTYRAGERRLIASLNGWRVNFQICYDLRFPVWTRQQRRVGEDGAYTPEYDLLVFVANWPERRNHAWKSLLPARAIENQCFVAAVNRVGEDGQGIYHSGDSMILDPLGVTVAQDAHKEATLLATLSADRLQDVRNQYPFWRDADSFHIIK